MNAVNRVALFACLAGALLVPGNASGELITLQRDGFVGGAAAFQAGFAEGEVAAVRFEPPGPFPMNVTELQFMFGDVAVQSVITVYIWEDAAGSNVPGAEIYSGGFLATGSAAVLNSINLVAAGVQVNGPFRVGLEFTHTGLPSVARDTDGTIDTANNFIRANGVGWYPSSLFGVTGDWILRAVVEASPATDSPAAPLEPQVLTLSPNPFNPATEVSFDLPVDGPVTIRAYDTRGREVESILEGAFLPAGMQTVPYRTDLSSGVYVMRVSSGSWWQTTKFTVVK
jgi:hypothetical protein